MRRLILAVMIVLLPLRGWIGDAMALEAAAGTPVAIHSVAVNDDTVLGSASIDGNSGLLNLSGTPGHCPDHASLLDGSTGADSDSATHGSACTVCQVCHTVAMSAEAWPFATLPQPVLAPATSLPRFTSALPAPGLKPPIY